MSRWMKHYALLGIGMALSAILPVSLGVLIATQIIETLRTVATSNASLSLLGRWQPASDQFGFVELIVSSLFATVPAVFLVLLLGTLFALAIYLHEGSRDAAFAKFALSIWAGVPSVIVGALLLVIATPVFGFSLMNAILAISFMVLPHYVLGLLAALPNDRGRLVSARAIGFSEWQVALCVLWPDMRPNVAELVMLALGRGMGEATCVALVSGGIVLSLPPGPFHTINTLSTAILRGYPVAETGGAYEAAINAVALGLLALVTLCTFLGSYLRQYAQKA